MKRTLTQNEKMVIAIATREYDFYVGGLFNCLLDYPEDSEEYLDAVEDLSRPEVIKQVVIDEIKLHITAFGKQARFASNAWIDRVVDRLIAKDDEYQEFLEFSRERV